MEETRTRIATYTFGAAPETEAERGGAVEGFNPDAVDGDDYATPRARALFDALGASPDDDEYLLGELPDGRWAVVGLTVEGHPFAVEETD